MNVETFTNYLVTDGTIPGGEVEEALRSDDLVVLGVLWQMVSSHWDRIAPAVDLVDCNRSIARYLLKCIEQNPTPDDFVCSNYEAARELLPLVHSMERGERERPGLVQETLENLREVYLRGDDNTRLCIETGFLEHLLEKRESIQWLKRWQADPRTANAITDSINGWYGPDEESPD
ncbi:hypothetical protein [Bremerella sp. P1]|uniref:hypothetical protein n=1 Tax=Bremerella sp. P1 TaxID=3026424 RepID=UPI0023680549|nr:hypothetical protein [Bremerella sp. P1]WDI42601.1 hypothetical protein PSR63_01405 [Bremerella sp. P1]